VPQLQGRGRSLQKARSANKTSIRRKASLPTESAAESKCIDIVFEIDNGNVGSTALRKTYIGINSGQESFLEDVEAIDDATVFHFLRHALGLSFEYLTLGFFRNKK
jgi:hypothetical protein